MQVKGLKLWSTYSWIVLMSSSSILLGACSSTSNSTTEESSETQSGYKEAPVLSSTGFKPLQLSTTPLKKFRSGKLRMLFRFPEVVFGQLGGSADTLEEDFDGMYKDFPVLFVKSGRFSDWKTVNLKNDFLNFRWTHVFSDPTSERYWGLLEYMIEGPGSDIPVIYSEDDGKTWVQISAVPKPHHMATAKDFRMSSDGKGYVELELDHGILLDLKGRRGSTRRYRALTSDWGKTWRLNLDRFEVDVLQGALPPNENDCSNLFPRWWKNSQPKICEMPKDLKKFEAK
jgi:hypothetical protein